MFSYKISGITLIELIISLCIITIISVLAIPSMKATFRQMEINRLQNTLRSAIHFSKTQAITQHKYTVICSSLDLKTCQNNQWHKGFIIFTDTNKNRLLDTDEHILWGENTHLKYGLLSWSSFGTRHLVTFSERNGLPIDSNGSFTYCSETSQQHFQLILSKMGHTRIEKIATC